MNSEKNISKNLADEILESMSDDGNESIYETPYAYHRYDDYDKSRPIEIVLNVSNDQSIDKSDDRDESVYEEPYSSNIYNVYKNYRPGKICLDTIFKHIAKRKWWFLLFVALIIGALVVGLSIYLTKNPEPVFVLGTYHPSNLPLVIGSNGEIDYDINFLRDFNTEVYESCTASLHDQMYVFGGRNFRSQISKVKDCKLTRVGELPFSFSGGGCNTFSIGIMMCFGGSSYKSCYSFNGDFENFKSEPSSNFPHRSVNALGSYRKSPFVTGSSWSSRDGLKTEILDLTAGQWNQVADYPFTNGEGYIAEYATSQTKDSVYVIGGRWKSGSSSSISTIAQFKDNEWKIAGNLKQARYGHGAIIVNGMTLIIGGSGYSLYTELFEYDSFETEEIEPKLDLYSPGLFLVEDGFCSKNLNQSTPEP